MTSDREDVERSSDDGRNDTEVDEVKKETEVDEAKKEAEVDGGKKETEGDEGRKETKGDGAKSLNVNIPASAVRSNMDNPSDARRFTLTFSIAEIVGTLAVILTVAWVGHFRNGFAWQSIPSLQFNWHPVLMVIGMIYIYGNSALLYRVFRNERKRKLKLAHALLNAACVLTASVGLKAVFDSHNLAKQPIPNLYSLHSWLGISAVVLFVAQWLVGCVCFLFPGASGSVRARVLPWHQHLGSALLILSCAAALMGLLEKAFFTLKPGSGSPSYSQLPAEAYLINVIGMLLVVFVWLVVHLLSHASYRRYPLPEDEVLIRDTIMD